LQSDPYFATLKGWGDAIWDLWLANGGSAPVLMTAAVSPPYITQAVRASDGYRVRFQSIPGWMYHIEKSPDLSPGSWSSIGTLAGDGTEKEFFDASAATASRAFYRLISEVTPD
jgi:hypothetical protein